jgi:hypothetical protein
MIKTEQLVADSRHVDLVDAVKKYGALTVQITGSHALRNLACDLHRFVGGRGI